MTGMCSSLYREEVNMGGRLSAKFVKTFTQAMHPLAPPSVQYIQANVTCMRLLRFGPLYTDCLVTKRSRIRLHCDMPSCYSLSVDLVVVSRRMHLIVALCTTLAFINDCAVEQETVDRNVLFAIIHNLR